MSKEVFLGSDHRGFEKKNQLVETLRAEGYNVVDLGPDAYDEQDDYNDAANNVAKAVREHAGSKGILICGSAHGIAIQANRYKGIRAIEGYTEDLARIGREHNDANILCLSADYIENNDFDKIANIFLNTEFGNEERHVRRNNKLDEVGEN